MQSPFPSDDGLDVVGTNGSIRPRRVTGWEQNVHTAEDAKAYIQQMYPQFPAELAEAYVIALTNKHLLGQKPVNKQQEWDFMAEVRQARQKCAEEMAAENARKLLEDYDLEQDQAAPTKKPEPVHRKGKRK